MKFRLLDLLKLPGTNEGFELEVFESNQQNLPVEFDCIKCQHHCHRLKKALSDVSVEDCQECYGIEITEGKLQSKESGAQFPIVRGVPRILPDALLVPHLSSFHPEFLVQYADRFNFERQLEYVVEDEKKSTVNAFSYQWTTFVNNFDYFKEIFLGFTRPFYDEPDFNGKLALEVGCGSGRPAVTACKMGAEVIAMDISEAVETTYSKSLEQPMLHVVQADAYAPPFRAGFDLVYCVGVLQHIPSPRKALQGILTITENRTPLLLWVYGKREWWYQPIEWLRQRTIKLPFRVLHVIAIILAVLSELFLLIPYRILKHIPGLKKIAERIPGRIYARFPFRENVVGWFDRLGAPVTCYFERDEIESLLKDVGFDQVQLSVRTEASASFVILAKKTSAQV